MQKSVPGSDATAPKAATASFSIVLALSLSHFLNDLVQALLPALYPIIKESYKLDYGQIGLLTLAFQLTAAMLQPLVGIVTDRRPQPYSLLAGMGLTFIGVFVLAYATTYLVLLVGAALIGIGSAVFHPEATRMARTASGGRHGFAQSIFQVGGQTGSAIGPLLAAFIVVPFGQSSLAWFSGVVLLAMVILFQVGRWYAAQAPQPAKAKRAAVVTAAGSGDDRADAVDRRIVLAVAILFLLMLSKSAYTASLSSYYTFHLIGSFAIGVQAAQMLLFVFLVSQAVGSLVGGYIGDRIGRRRIIWISILGALPFTLMLPFANLFWTVVLTTIIGAIMASAFPAILTYALELMPRRVGMIAGLFYGVSFGLGALSAALLGELADVIGLDAVYKLCSLLPMIGLLTWFLPRAVEEPR
jgi:FSR family fosmidomycin resistance protein-like MFS transporter